MSQHWEERWSGSMWSRGWSDPLSGRDWRMDHGDTVEAFSER